MFVCLFTCVFCRWLARKLLLGRRFNEFRSNTIFCVNFIDISHWMLRITRGMLRILHTTSIHFELALLKRHFYFYFYLQIVRNQIHRYQSTTPVEYEKESDPTQEHGDHNDILSTRITLAIVLTAFFISPMTECLGPVLELNVRFQLFCQLNVWTDFHADFFNRFFQNPKLKWKLISSVEKQFYQKKIDFFKRKLIFSKENRFFLKKKKNIFPIILILFCFSIIFWHIE